MHDRQNLAGESSLAPNHDPGFPAGRRVAARPHSGSFREPKPWLLVFDLDGTLIDSSQDLCASINAALRAVGYRTLESDVIASFIGDGAATLVQRALTKSVPVGCAAPPIHVFESCFRYFLDHYQAHKLDNTHTYDGVLTSLRTIRDACPEVLMAVLTNKPVRPSQEICEALGLSSYFFAIYGGDSFPTKKPAPHGLQTIMKEATALRLKSSSDAGAELLASAGVIVIGDSAVDVEVGRRCGARILGCSYGLACQALFSACPDKVVESARRWPDLLGCAAATPF